jgi:hypothetical protein
MARGVKFSPEDARRIAAATKAYERGNRDSSPVRFRQPPDDSDGEQVRLGTVDATWTKGDTATVTRLNGDGTATDPSETFEATNYFATVTVASGTKKVACGLVGSTWILIAAEC